MADIFCQTETGKRTFWFGLFSDRNTIQNLKDLTILAYSDGQNTDVESW